MKQIPLKKYPYWGHGTLLGKLKRGWQDIDPGIGKGGAVDAFVGTRYDQFMVFNDTNSS
jgi:hypothetical protein